jgi:hypothetical protein
MAGSKKKAKRRERAQEPRAASAAPTPPPSPARSNGRAVLSEMVPVRFDPATLEEVRRHAAADDRSVSAWIRRAVDQELRREMR